MGGMAAFFAFGPRARGKATFEPERHKAVVAVVETDFIGAGAVADEGYEARRIAAGFVSAMAGLFRAIGAPCGGEVGGIRDSLLGVGLQDRIFGPEIAGPTREGLVQDFVGFQVAARRAERHGDLPFRQDARGDAAGQMKRHGAAQCVDPKELEEKAIKGFTRRIRYAILQSAPGRGAHQAHTGTMTRNRPALGQIIYVGICLLLAGTFAFAAMQGNYGLFRRAEVVAETQRLQAELSQIEDRVARMENLTLRLSDEYLDLDLLDEQARSVLGLLRVDEVVIR